MLQQVVEALLIFTHYKNTFYRHFEIIIHCNALQRSFT